MENRFAFFQKFLFDWAIPLKLQTSTMQGNYYPVVGLHREDLTASIIKAMNMSKSHI